MCNMLPELKIGWIKATILDLQWTDKGIKGTGKVLLTMTKVDRKESLR